MAVNTNEFVIALITDVIICIIVLFLFAIIRLLPILKKFYTPKSYIESKREKPKELPNNTFTWVFALYNYSEKDILETSGMDALVYLLIFKFGVKLFFVIAIFSLCTVLPANLSCNEVNILLSTSEIPSSEDDEFAITDFDKLSISNVPEASNKLWVHVLCCYFVTIYTLWLLWNFHLDAVKLRIQYLSTTQMGAESHSVLVTDIPGSKVGTLLEYLYRLAPEFLRPYFEKALAKTYDSIKKSIRDISQNLDPTEATTSLLQSEVNEIEEDPSKIIFVDSDSVKRARELIQSGKIFSDMVLEEFQNVYSKETIAAVNVVRDTRELDRIFSTYEKTKRKLEDIVDQNIRLRNRNKAIKLKYMKIIPVQYGKWAMDKYGALKVGVKVPSLTFLSEYLNQLKKKIIEKQDETYGMYLPTAFVTFTSRYTQTVAASSLHATNEDVWQIYPAPEPKEIIWSNLYMRKWEISVRGNLMWALFWCICIFYLIPITALQALIEIDRLDDYPIMEDILNVAFIRSLLVAILPGLILKLFISVLPYILMIMGNIAGIRSMSQLDFSVINKFFIFLVISVFFGSFITGSILTQIQLFVQSPGEIIELLGTSAPQTASFFCTYIMVDAFITAPTFILRYLDFIIYYSLSIMAATERAKERLLKNYMIFGNDLPNHSLTILLGLVFSSVNPIITVLAVFYFMIYWFVWKYQLIYVYSEKYQSGGKIWTQVFNQILLALIIMQLMMIGLMGLKKFVYTFFLFPLPIITFIFYHIASNKFRRPLNVLSIRTATDLDKTDKLNENYVELLIEKCQELYLSPSFKLDSTEHENLISEAIEIAKSIDQNIDISDSLSSYKVDVSESTIQ